MEGRKALPALRGLPTCQLPGQRLSAWSGARGEYWDVSGGGADAADGYSSLSAREKLSVIGFKK